MAKSTSGSLCPAASVLLELPGLPPIRRLCSRGTARFSLSSPTPMPSYPLARRGDRSSSSGIIDCLLDQATFGAKVLSGGAGGGVDECEQCGVGLIPRFVGVVGFTRRFEPGVWIGLGADALGVDLALTLRPDLAA